MDGMTINHIVSIDHGSHVDHAGEHAGDYFFFILVWAGLECPYSHG